MREQDVQVAKRKLIRQVGGLAGALPIPALTLSGTVTPPGLLGIVVAPLALLSLYLTFFAIPYWAARLMVAKDLAGARLKLVYVGWTGGLLFLLSGGSFSQAVRAARAIPEYVNSNGIAVVVLTSVLAVLYGVIKTNTFRPVSLYPFIPSVSVAIPLALPSGTAYADQVVLPSTGFLVAVTATTLCVHLGLLSRSEA